MRISEIRTDIPIPEVTNKVHKYGAEILTAKGESRIISDCSEEDLKKAPKIIRSFALKHGWQARVEVNLKVRSITYWHNGPAPLRQPRKKKTNGAEEVWGVEQQKEAKELAPHLG